MSRKRHHHFSDISAVSEQNWQPEDGNDLKTRSGKSHHIDPFYGQRSRSASVVQTMEISDGSDDQGGDQSGEKREDQLLEQQRPFKESQPTSQSSPIPSATTPASSRSQASAKPKKRQRIGAESDESDAEMQGSARKKSREAVAGLTLKEYEELKVPPPFSSVENRGVSTGGMDEIIARLQKVEISQELGHMKLDFLAKRIFPIADYVEKKENKGQKSIYLMPNSRMVDQFKKPWKSEFATKFKIELNGNIRQLDGTITRRALYEKIKELQTTEWDPPMIGELNFAAEINSALDGFIGRFDQIAKIGRAVSLFLWPPEYIETHHMTTIRHKGERKTSLGLGKNQIPSEEKHFFIDVLMYLGPKLIARNLEGTEKDQWITYLKLAREYLCETGRRSAATTSSNNGGKKVTSADEMLKVDETFVPVFCRETVKLELEHLKRQKLLDIDFAEGEKENQRPGSGCSNGSQIKKTTPR